MWLADAAGGPGEGLGCAAAACLSSQWPPARTKTSQAAPRLGFQDQLSLWFSNWGKKRGFWFVCFFKYKTCKTWSWSGFSLPIRAVDAGSVPGWIRRLGCLKVCREALGSVKPGKKSSLSLRSPYILSQIILCAETDVPKCVKPLHKVSPIFYFLIRTTSKDFLESLSGLVCRNDLLYWREKCFLVTLFTGERAIFPEDCYVFQLLFCPEGIVRF